MTFCSITFPTRFSILTPNFISIKKNGSYKLSQVKTREKKLCLQERFVNETPLWSFWRIWSNLIESAASNFGPDYTVLHERTEVTHSS